jgi:hypothetical protein
MHEIAPGGSVQPTGIAAGVDGGIWYTEQRTNRVGRVDLASLAITRYALPVASGGPTAIALGADGAMWFTLRGSNEIGRIDATGAITTFPIPTATAQPSSIAPGGPDWMWFSQTGVDQVARIALADGTVEEFATDAGAGPVGVVANGTGAWFTEGSLNRLTHLSLGGDPEPDLVAPTIDLWSPGAGAWTVRNSDALDAGYECHDEGGSGLSECGAAVPSGSPVPDGSLGERSLDVVAKDGAGNAATASAPYLVFGGVWGNVVDGAPLRAGTGSWLTLRMDLGRRAPDPLAAATTQVVDCTTGEPLADPEDAEVHRKLGPWGHLLWVWWDSDREWAGQCRTLTLSFDAAGWDGAEATFGPVSFVGQRHRWWWGWWWRG